MSGTTVYQLVAEPSVLRSKKTFGWTTADVRGMRLVDLFGLYRNIEVPLTDIFDNKLTLNLYEYEGELRDSVLTLNAWVAALGDRALITTSGYPKLEVQIANYLPIGFSLESMLLAKRGYHPSHVVPIEDYADIVVSHPRVSPKTMHEYTLCSVNGYYVDSTHHDYGMRLFEAGNIVRRSGNIALGMLNFEAIGKVTKIPVLKNMVHKVDDTMTYLDSVVVNVGSPLKGKTVGLVLGGHLHLLDGLVKIIGDQTIMFSMRQMRYIERVLAARDSLDMSFMGLDVLDVSSLVAGLSSDDSILKYLTCPHTFVVLIDNPNVYTEEVLPDQTGRWGQYTMDGEADLGGLYDQYGQCIDYWPKWEMNQWSLDTLRDETPTALFRTTGWLKQMRINDAAIGAKPWDPIVATMKYIKART